jgi:serine/threonine-protein kinase
MADAPIQPGDLLATKYRVDRVLGEGTMGVVVAATDLALDRRVAIKVMRSSVAVKRDKQERFLREARVVAKLQSEHAVKVLDMGLFREAPFIVMEYLEGQDLAAVLEQRGGLPIDEAVALILQACEAIAEAHAEGIVHRDIKPANLFLTRNRDGSTKLKVVDFGIAKYEKSSLSLTGTAEILGSPLYMSPEAIQGTKDVDGRTDVWALACCLFEMLAGVSPFAQDTFEALVGAVFHFPTPPLTKHRPDAPPGLVEAIERALEKKRELRTPSAAAFAAEIAPYGPPGFALRALTAGTRDAGVVQAPPAAPLHTESVVSVAASPSATSTPAATLVDPPSEVTGSAVPAGKDTRSRRATTVFIVLATGITTALVVGLLVERAARTNATAPTAPVVTPTLSETIPQATVDHSPTVTVSASPTPPATATATTSAPPASHVKPRMTAPPAVPGDGLLNPWKGGRR